MEAYRLTTASRLDQLEAEVDAWVKRGWEPLGGVAVNKIAHAEIEFVQAMVRRRNMTVPE